MQLEQLNDRVPLLPTVHDEVHEAVLQVCSMTLGPAKATRAPGSARVMSASMAKEAVTPPVVGSVSTAM